MAGASTLSEAGRSGAERALPAARAAGRGRAALARRAALGLLLFSVAVSISYFHVARYDLYDPATGGRHGDVAQYVRLAQGVPLEEIPKPYRYRILVPWLASLVPVPGALLDGIYEVSPEKLVSLRFGVVNSVALAAAAGCLFALLGLWGFAPSERLIGSLLFLTAFYVVNWATTPMVDAAAYAFLTAALWCALTQRGPALCAVVCVGMFAKETLVLSVPLVLLLVRERAQAWRLCAWCAPGMLAYAIFRLQLPTELGYRYDPATLLAHFRRLGSPARLAWLAIDLVQVYGALWILAALGWRALRQPAHPLARGVWILPIVFALPLVLGTNFGRIWFLSFPVVIPMALLGLRRVLAEDAR